MVRFPNCKINLGLHVLGKRADGYHNLETVFYPVLIHDALEILPAPHLQQPQLTLSGLPVFLNDDSNNLCSKAWHLLQHNFPALPAIHIHLHKAIPIGAGLGGGSADGTVTLMMLNELFNLQLPIESLAGYALQLGSDCPFFIYNKPCFATGRGEQMQPTAISLSGYYFYIVNPNLSVSTASAFAELQYTNHTSSLKEVIQKPIENWKESLMNDFENGIAKQHPAINTIKQQLYAHGAMYAAMSGSGSTVFGIFTKKPSALYFPENYFSKIILAG